MSNPVKIFSTLFFTAFFCIAIILFIQELNRIKEVEKNKSYWYEKPPAIEPVKDIEPTKNIPKKQAKPDFTITNTRWYKDKDFGSRGSVIWIIEVKNNTNKYVKRLKVEFTTYDHKGQIMDTAYGYITGLSPKSVKSYKGYATYFGQESKAAFSVASSFY